MATLNGLFDDLMKRGGSDLHLTANQPPLARVRGEMVVLREAALSTKELEDALLELISPAQRARLCAEKELDVGVEYKDVARFRAHFYVERAGIAATFRLVPLSVPSLAELSCPEVFWRLADRRSGLIVVAGPASSGKTTTAAALIDHVNKTRACHVVTIESPIEFVHDALRAQITQRAVPDDVPTFTAALRNVGREDADVVLVSELTSAEDVAAALGLASNGALVVALVATSGVISTIDHLLGFFDDGTRPRMRSVLAGSLTGVIVQHLMRTMDGKSRFAVYEILVGSEAVSALVQDDEPEALAEAIRTGEVHGMQSLDASLERFLSLGRITAEAALERSIDKEAFARILARVRPDLVDLTS
jgi:twitching motility protein PilT